MLGRPRRSLWASRARRFALGIGATVLYRFLFTLPGINLNFRSSSRYQGVGFNVETLLRQFVLTLKLRKC